MQPLKCLVLGPEKAGKTTYVNRLTTGDFTREYLPTQGVTESTYSLTWWEEEWCRFTLVDGKEEKKVREELEDEVPPSLDDFSPDRVDCAIILFDRADLKDPTIILEWMSKLASQCGSVPFVVCGNKADQPIEDAKELNKKLRRFIRTFKISYFDISAKSCYNFEKPWQHLAKEFGCQEPEKPVVDLEASLAELSVEEN